MSGVSRPFFSIIIPTLNEELFLPKLLSCLKKQSEKDFEVIVVDGNSVDKTKTIARSAKVTVYNVKKRNVAFQRNYGAQKACGEYFMFVDADFQISSSYVSRAKKFIHKNKGLLFIPPMKPGEKELENQLFHSVVNQLVKLSLTSKKPMATSGSIIFERNFFYLVGGYEEKLFVGEDVNIVQKAARWGVHAKFLTNNYVTFSYRRVAREGKLRSFSKFFVSTAHILLKGDIKRKIYNYEMGGHLYNSVPAPRSKRSRTK